MTVPARSPFTGRWGTATDTGAVRRHNEDSLLASPPIFLVADGMGGHDAGDVASAMVVASFAGLLGRPMVSEEDVRQAVVHARQSVTEYFELSGRSGGSTLTGIAVSSVDGEAAVVVVNIGDSRTYRLSGGVLEQLSKDHSTVQELVDSGAIQPIEARTHPERNVITRAISPSADSEPDVWSVPARVGDRYLVCSDGLTGELTDAEIRGVLLTCDDPQAAASALVAGALANRGRDNITVVVVDVVQVACGDAHGGLWERPAPLAADPSLEDTIPTP